MSVEVYKYDKREFPHCGVGPLDCDDEINPIVYNDQATALNMGRRMVPRRIISDTGALPTRGNIQLDFELSPFDPDYLLYIEFKLDRCFTFIGNRTGNLKIEFGIFSNPNVRQVIGQYFVSQADYAQEIGPIQFPNISFNVNGDFQGITLSGQLDPALTSTNPGRMTHGFLRITLSYPNISTILYNQGIAFNYFTPVFTHPETGEQFNTSGVKGLMLYTGEL